MGIITSKRKVDSSGCAGIVTNTRYEKLKQEDSTICDEKSPSVLGKDVQTAEQIDTNYVGNVADKQIEKQKKDNTKQSKSLTVQYYSCNGHPSNFSIRTEPRSLLENPLLKRAEGESGSLKPVNPFRIGKEKDQERIDLFESGLVNPHNRAGIIKHDIDPKEEEIIGELKGIGIISKRGIKPVEHAEHQNEKKAPLFTEIPFEFGSSKTNENVHVLAGLSEISLKSDDNKNEHSEQTTCQDDTLESNGQLALKLIDIDVV
ncbi:hypothetical protein ACF0H5_003536 [Mactra antiquata]